MFLPHILIFIGKSIKSIDLLLFLYLHKVVFAINYLQFILFILYLLFSRSAAEKVQMLFFKIYLQFSQFFLFTVYCLHAHYLYCHKSHEQKKYILIFALCLLIYVYIYILFWNVLHFSRSYCWCEKQKQLRSVKESRIFREFSEHRGIIIKSKRLP